MKKELEITLDGFDFTVQGLYRPYRLASLLEPPEHACFEIEDVLLYGNSIYELLSDETIEQLEEAALARCEDEPYYDEDLAQARYYEERYGD